MSFLPTNLRTIFECARGHQHFASALHHERNHVIAQQRVQQAAPLPTNHHDHLGLAFRDLTHRMPTIGNLG